MKSANRHSFLKPKPSYIPIEHSIEVFVNQKVPTHFYNLLKLMSQSFFLMYTIRPKHEVEILMLMPVFLSVVAIALWWL